MAKQLIQLDEGMLVQVTVPESEVKRLAKKKEDEIEKIEVAFEKVKDVILKGCKPLTETWKLLNKEMKAETAEVEFGIGFSAKGNIYFAEASSQATLKVKINWKFED